MVTCTRGFLAVLAVAAVALGTAATAQAADRPGTIPRFSSGGAIQHPLVDSDAQGRATATWIRIGREREAWTADFNGRKWSCPKVLPGSTGALGWAGATWHLAESASGAAVLGGSLNSDGAYEGAAVWTRAGVGKPWVQVKWSDPGSFAVGQAAHPPSVAVNGTTALAAWVAQDANTSSVYAVKVQVGSNARVTPTLLYSRSEKGTMDTDPDVGIDAQANAMIQFEDWVDYDNLLLQSRWPAGAGPATTVFKSDIETKDYLTSMHVNAAGQMITSWGYAPDGAPQYQQWIGFGDTTSGVTSEGVWQAFGADGVYSYPETVGTDIDDAGNAALMVIYEEQLVGGLGSVAGGLGSVAPRASMGIQPSDEHWDVTVRGGRATVSLTVAGGSSILEELVGDGFVTVATVPDMTQADSAFVAVSGAPSPAMVGTNLGERAFRTTLPTRTRRC